MLLWAQCRRLREAATARGGSVFGGGGQATQRTWSLVADRRLPSKALRLGRESPYRLGSRRPLCTQRTIARPIEKRTGGGLASGRNIGVAIDALRRDGWIDLHDRARQIGQSLILRRLKWLVFRAFQLYSDREIVDSRPPLATGLAGMPGAQM